jgi:hypothetical protein
MHYILQIYSGFEVLTSVTEDYYYILTIETVLSSETLVKFYLTVPQHPRKWGFST